MWIQQPWLDSFASLFVSIFCSLLLIRLLLLFFFLLLLRRHLPTELYSILLAVDDPADAHIAEIEVTVVAVWALPTFSSQVMVEADLATLAAISEADDTVALPLVFVFIFIFISICISIHNVLTLLGVYTSS